VGIIAEGLYHPLVVGERRRGDYFFTVAIKRQNDAERRFISTKNILGVFFPSTGRACCKTCLGSAALIVVNGALNHLKSNFDKIIASRIK